MFVSQPSVGGVKSIQRGTITLYGVVSSGTATISSVSTTRSEITLLGSPVNASVNTDAEYFTLAGVRISLTNATTVTATLVSPIDASIQIDVAFQVTEYY